MTGKEDNHTMKEAIIYVLFDNWCNTGHDPEVKEAMDKAIKNPTLTSSEPKVSSQC